MQQDAVASGTVEDKGHAKDIIRKELEELFDQADADLQLPSPTPTSGRQSEHAVKTPKLTPRRFGNTISANVRRTPQLSGHQSAVSVLLGLDKTPASMTPFTRSIHDALMNVSDTFPPMQALSSSGPMLVGSSPRVANKTHAHFDFPDLPPLHGSSPNNITTFQFDLSDFTTDHLNTNYDDIFSTDGPMASTDGAMLSSPPIAFLRFGSSDGINETDDWHGGVSLVEQTDDILTSPLKVQSHVLRRSPRKRGI